jgi:molecular chaperone GrpE
MKKQEEEPKNLKKEQESCSQNDGGKECQCSETEKAKDKDCKKDKCVKELEAKIADLEKKNEALAGEKENLGKALAKEKDDYIRLMAEFETFRRRTSEEKLSLVSTAASDTIKGLLPVLDDCERAMELLSKSSDEAAKEGTGLIYDKLMKYLKSKGLEVIDAKGKKFDTDFHEAVAQTPVAEDKKGLVYDVIETGYLLGGKILRYAKVVVGI